MGKDVFNVLLHLYERLSGWQRVGIVLSIVWALGAGFYTHNADVERANNFAQFSYKVCSYSKSLAHNSDLTSCGQEREKHLKIWMQGSDSNVVFAALAPIPFGWLAAFVLLYVIRAQIVGFRAVVPWATLSRPKKAFVAFCALASFVVALFGLTVVLDLYVDTQVPVALAAPAMVIKTGEDFVTAEGTWTRLDLTDGDSIANPLQTSRIECNKVQSRCTEARASVSGNLLLSDLVEYDVVSWTASSIVLRNDALCATEMFTIDLNTEAVSGAGHLINQGSAFCKNDPINTNKKERWNYRLSDGFSVYWEQRKKARPYLLRFIQSLFGN